MAGVTAGAVIQSAASWRIAVAFAGPVMLATLIRMLMSADPTGYVLGLDTAFFAAMLTRAAFIAEASFIANQRTAIEATQLAKSLETANRALGAQAHTDPLTGLANRIGFRDAAEALCRGGRPASMILLDLDEFKSINDTQGHRVGDAVLEAVASRLRAECDAEALAVRLGGDEFIVLMWGNDLERRTRGLAERLLLRFEERLTFDGRTIAFSGSLGVAMDLGGAENADILLAQADRALYRGKREGGARVFLRRRDESRTRRPAPARSRSAARAGRATDRPRLPTAGSHQHRRTLRVRSAVALEPPAIGGDRSANGRAVRLAAQPDRAIDRDDGDARLRILAGASGARGRGRARVDQRFAERIRRRLSGRDSRFGRQEPRRGGRPPRNRSDRRNAVRPRTPRRQDRRTQSVRISAGDRRLRRRLFLDERI